MSPEDPLQIYPTVLGVNAIVQCQMAPRTRTENFAQAYLKMSKFYRPAAPGDGMGGVYLDDDERRDRTLLNEEALRYAREFVKHDDHMEYWTGCTNFTTAQAFVFVIEAARLLCSGTRDEPAKCLLRMAIAEIDRVRGE